MTPETLARKYHGWHTKALVNGTCPECVQIVAAVQEARQEALEEAEKIADDLHEKGLDWQISDAIAALKGAARDG